ncbi:TSUP family transporter [Alicyclobacillus tolerans]|uniref:TSUP family transporter n=1 Tax=Alicyclobacillus tolerans TaxID=90970 RepID=UPI001F02F948|nr:TSUP family transporter [Alicyclobacillus tolerans]MCF8564373.1 TSUP family transporter [Alicyclobacillus tolerans]
MPHVQLTTVLILLLVGFLSAFIDSTVGGGGLVSLPALLFVGLPPALALGTNKLAGTMSALTSSLSYLKSGKIQFKLVKLLLPLSLLGAIAGAYLVHHLPTAFLRPLVIVLLIAVTAYTVLKRNMGQTSTYRGINRRLFTVSCLVALILGFYDGFFGPGTGSFLIISFLFMGFDFVQAAGNAKALNLASNVGGLLTFAMLHSVNYWYGVIVGAGMIVGAIVGSQVAIRKGVNFVRPLFIAVTVIMIGQQLWTWIG